MSISKKYLKTKPICKVTFRIPPEIGNMHRKASLLGSFNNWNQSANRMRKLIKDGSFSVVVDLDINKEYEFKYLLDDEIWLNDDNPDKEVKTHFGDSSNSIVAV